MYGVSIMIMVFVTLSTALSGEGPATSAVGIIIFWRVLLGVGIGGGCPMAAVITSEFASTRYRGRMMAAVFSMQGAVSILVKAYFVVRNRYCGFGVLFHHSRLPRGNHLRS